MHPVADHLLGTGMPGDPKTIRRKSVICRKGKPALWQLNRRPGDIDGLASIKDVAQHLQEATKSEDGSIFVGWKGC
jgi:hypothetical protein